MLCCSQTILREWGWAFFALFLLLHFLLVLAISRFTLSVYSASVVDRCRFLLISGFALLVYSAVEVKFLLDSAPSSVLRILFHTSSALCFVVLRLLHSTDGLFTPSPSSVSFCHYVTAKVFSFFTSQSCVCQCYPFYFVSVSVFSAGLSSCPPSGNILFVF